MSDILNRYARYFNLRHKRRGPLWESRFRNVLVETDEQLLHLSRYLHLNPITANLVRYPNDWRYSSYLEYLGAYQGFCDYENRVVFEKNDYRNFVEDYIQYQKELASLKRLILE